MLVKKAKSASIISVLKNRGKCKYIFVFSKLISAQHELTQQELIIFIVNTLILCYQVSCDLSWVHDIKPILIDHLYNTWVDPVELNIILLLDNMKYIQCCL